MTNTKSTKRALLTSVISLLLCFAMLIGTTFAWFTDSVTSANNIIVSGNLDIELEYWNGTDWADVAGASDILTNELWEPGATDVAYLRVKNAGSLALKYQLGINIVSEKAGVNVQGNEFLLSDYIQFGVKEGVAFDETTKAPTTYATREDAIGAVGATKKISAGYSKAASMQSGDELYLALVVYMPTAVDNVANHKTSDDPADPNKYRPEIKLGINVLATQLSYEEDSFGSDYDVAAPWTGMIDTSWYNTTDTTFVLSSAEQLAGLAAIVNGTAVNEMTRSAIAIDSFKGKTVTLDADLDLNNIPWVPIGAGDVNGSWIGFNGKFDGNGHTVYNLTVTKGGGWNGLFGLVGRGAGAGNAAISNLTIENVKIEGANRMTGGVVGQIYGNIENCHVKNVNISAVPNALGDTYDNGDKIGGIVGWHGDNGNKHFIKDCSAINVTLKAYRDVGGITGYIGQSSIVSGCAVDAISITVDQITNHYGVKDINAGAIVGRVYADPVTIENNTEANVSFDKNIVVKGYGDILANSGESTDYAITEDMTADDYIFFRPGTTNSIDLGGNTITAGNTNQYIFIAQSGGKLTLNGDGTVNCGKGFMASSGDVEIEVNGGTYNSTISDSVSLGKFSSVVQNGATMVINGGTFTTNVVDSALFYVSNTARIEIKGGFFENTADKTPDLLTLATNKNNTNRIVITGGTFVNYNPMADRMCYTGAWPAAGEAAFGGPWILIPGDYTVVAEAQANGDIWYSVVPVE